MFLTAFSLSILIIISQPKDVMSKRFAQISLIEQSSGWIRSWCCAGQFAVMRTKVPINRSITDTLQKCFTASDNRCINLKMLNSIHFKVFYTEK